jgi:hypothetical protein
MSDHLPGKKEETSRGPVRKRSCPGIDTLRFQVSEDLEKQGKKEVNLKGALPIDNDENSRILLKRAVVA